jgi:hypothetical protein
MDMVYEVDLILDEAFMLKYDCILHYDKGCITFQKGKRHMIVSSPALPRNQSPVEEERSASVLSVSQLKRKAWRGAQVFLAVIRSVESNSVPPLVASIATLFLVPTSSVQPDQPAAPPRSAYLGFPICCLIFLKCFSILCRLVRPLNVQKGTVYLQSQIILLCFGRYTFYLRWNIESWKSRSPSFRRTEYSRYPRVLTVLLSCLCQSLTVETCVCVLTIKR